MEPYEHRIRIRVRFRVRFRVRVRLGGGVVGSVLVSTLDSVHSTFIELQLLLPQYHIHIPPRPLLFRRYKPNKKVAQRAPIASNVRLVASTMRTCLG